MHSVIKNFWLFEKHNYQWTPLDNWRNCYPTSVHTSLALWLLSQIYCWTEAKALCFQTFSFPDSLGIFSSLTGISIFTSSLQPSLYKTFLANTACCSNSNLTGCSPFSHKPFWHSAESINIWNVVLNINTLLLCKRAAKSQNRSFSGFCLAIL